MFYQVSVTISTQHRSNSLLCTENVTSFINYVPVFLLIERKFKTIVSEYTNVERKKPRRQDMICFR